MKKRIEMQELLNDAIAIRVGTKWYRGIILGSAREIGQWVTFDCEWSIDGGEIKRFTFPLDQITGIESR